MIAAPRRAAPQPAGELVAMVGDASLT